jgi:hypothetical protein
MHVFELGAVILKTLIPIIAISDFKIPNLTTQITYYGNFFGFRAL